MEENKFLEILKKHGSKFILAFLLVGCISVWAERLFKSNKSHAGQDYQTINQSLEQFQKGEPFSIEALLHIENILKKRPELHAKCDSMLAAVFYSQQNIAKTLAFAKAALNNVKDELPTPYQQYSGTTLLIIEKKYDQALEEAKKLHAEIKNAKEYETLCGLNMIRILFLADAMNQATLKEQALTEFKAHSSFASLSSFFQEGNVGLLDYFQSY